MNIDNNYIITIILGILIGSIFGYIILKPYKYRGPDSNIVVKEVHTDSNGKKYKWVPKVCICPSYYSMNKFNNVKELHNH